MRRSAPDFAHDQCDTERAIHFTGCKIFNFENICQQGKSFAKLEVLLRAKYLTEILLLARCNRKDLDSCQNQLEIIDFATILRDKNPMEISTFVLILHHGKSLQKYINSDVINADRILDLDCIFQSAKS